jgi:imidazolonepropionase
MVIGLGSTLLRMSAIEALAAATSGAARALDRDGEIGALVPGAAADLVAWEATHEGAFWLALGHVVPRRVFIGGRESTPG